MAVYSIIGNSLISPEELYNKTISGEMDSLRSIENLKNSSKEMNFFNNTIKVNTLPDLHKNLRENFEPIGIGKPLSIEIATIYTGEYERFFGSKKDVIVVTGLKNSQTFQAISRAINVKSSNINQNEFLKFEAFSDGTPIVYYSPAMDADDSVVSFEIMFDNFDGGLFNTIGDLLTSAAGIPIFIPAAPYLLGGGQLVNIGSKLGEALFSGKAKLSGSIPIKFNSPIIPATEPKEFIIFNDQDKEEFTDLQLGLFKDSAPQLRLINKNNNSEYKGYAPYMIVILNGAKRQNLESFAPTIASASLLRQFYGGDNQTEIISVLQDAMKLYNDSVYRTKGEKLKKQLEKVPKDSTEYSKLKNLYEAYSANIQTDNFKLDELA